MEERLLEGYFLIKSPRSSSYFKTNGRMKDNRSQGNIRKPKSAELCDHSLTQFQKNWAWLRYFAKACTSQALVLLMMLIPKVLQEYPFGMVSLSG